MLSKRLIPSLSRLSRCTNFTASPAACLSSLQHAKIPHHHSYSTKIECINSTKAPKAVGPYSQAVKAGGQIWVSGCLGLIPESGEFPSEDISEQTRQALSNLVNVLEESNSSLERVVKTTVLLEDINDFKKVNEVYSEYFSTHKPARACYAVKDLPKGAKVEIEAIAIEG